MKTRRFWLYLQLLRYIVEASERSGSEHSRRPVDSVRLSAWELAFINGLGWSMITNPGVGIQMINRLTCKIIQLAVQNYLDLVVLDVMLS